MSGCGKLLSHEGSEAPHSLTSNTSNVPASELSNTPTPTPSPKETIPVLPNPVNTGSSVVNIGLCVVIAVVYYGGCNKLLRGCEKFLREFASIKFVPVNELPTIK